MARKIPELKKRIAYRMYKNGGYTGNEIAKTLGMSNGATWIATVGRDKGFSSSKDHLDYLARQQTNPETGKHFTGHYQYEDYLARQKINPETGEKYKSFSEYSANLAQKRKTRKENKELSNFISFTLGWQDKSPKWLAEQVGIHPSTVSDYIQGKQIPSPRLLQRIFQVLEAPYQTIEDLIEDS